MGMLLSEERTPPLSFIYIYILFFARCRFLAFSFFLFTAEPNDLDLSCLFFLVRSCGKREDVERRKI